MKDNSQNNTEFFAANENLSHSTFNWNLVAKSNPDNIRLTRDTVQMNAILNSFLSANFCYNDQAILTTPLSFRLIQLLQVILEYLTQTQEQIEKSYNNEVKKNRNYINKNKLLKQALQKEKQRNHHLQSFEIRQVH